MGSDGDGFVNCVFCGKPKGSVGKMELPMNWECPWCNGSAMYDGPWRTDGMEGLGPIRYWRPSKFRCAFVVPEGVMLVVDDLSKEMLS